MSEKIDRYRRAYFALWKKLPGTEHTDRHDFNERVTRQFCGEGKRSTKDFDMRDWDAVVAELQRMNGQHDDVHAHVRSPKQGGVSGEEGRWCTWQQAETIEELADQVDWGQTSYAGALEYELNHHLRRQEKSLRRKRLERQAREVADEGRDPREVWRVLTRSEASALIQALEEMRNYYKQNSEIAAGPSAPRNDSDREPRSASHDSANSNGGGSNEHARD